MAQGTKGANQAASPGQALALRPEDLNLFLTNQVGGEIARAIPTGVTLSAQAIIGQAVMALRNSPYLRSCSHTSIASSVIYAAQVGLELATPRGYCWLIPYAKDCTFQIGYKGLLALGYRSNKIDTAYAETVCKNDHFIYRQSAAGDKFEFEKRLEGERGEMFAAFLRVKFKNRTEFIHVMRADEIYEIRDKCSRSAYDTAKEGWKKQPEYLKGPWKDWPGEMAKKTVTKQGLKTLDLQPELNLAIGADDEAMATGHQARPPMPSSGIIEVRSWEIIERAQLTAPAANPSTKAPPEGQPPPEPPSAGQPPVDPKLSAPDFMPDPGKGLGLRVNFAPKDQDWILMTVRFCFKWNKPGICKWMGDGLGNEAHVNDTLSRWSATTGQFLDEIEKQRIFADDIKSKAPKEAAK